MKRIGNPKCSHCGNIYNPKTVQMERTLYPLDSKPVAQWHCDECGEWVDLDKCELVPFNPSEEDPK